MTNQHTEAVIDGVLRKGMLAVYRDAKWGRRLFELLSTCFDHTGAEQQ